MAQRWASDLPGRWRGWRGRPCGLRAVTAAVLGVLAALSPGSALADGSFFQLDLADRGSSLTALVRRGPATLTLGWSEFPSGHAASLWGSYGVSLGGGAWLRAGPAVRRDNQGRRDLGLRVGLERYSASERGFVFLLAEGTTIQREYLLLAEAGHSASRTSVGVTVQGNRAGFRERSLVAGYRLEGTPVTLRAGYRTRARSLFLGISVNTF